MKCTNCGYGDLMLSEDGYSRSWSTNIDDQDKVITAGDDMFGDEGTGEYLECLYCLHKMAIPDDYTIDWR